MKEQRNWLEWTVFCIGLGLVSLVLGYLSYLGVTRENTPPLLEVKIGEVLSAPSGYHVKVEVTNHGKQTAQAVEVEATLRSPGQEPEHGRFVLDFVPENTPSEGFVSFSSNPAAPGARIQARVLGFKVP